ncbi:MAG: Tad domain-containing protein [Candidatus Riflebacteria bacterium]|nr:Tad domain-containing protein [Candidatus Riflebacteria bacterium]
MTALGAFFFLGMTALVTDVGFMYYSQARLQTAVNAGWKAGYDKMVQLRATNYELTQQHKDQITAHIKEVIGSNGFSDEDLANMEIVFGRGNRLDISSKKKVGLFFARVLNFNATEVAASRSNPLDDAEMAPWGMPHGPVRDVSKNVYTWDPFAENDGFTENREYILKLGDGEVVQSGDVMPFGLEVKTAGDIFFGYKVGVEYSIKGSPGDPTFDMPPTGNFGALALGSRGANEYEDVIVYGYDGPKLNIGDEIDSEPGNMAGPTQRGIAERILNGQVNVMIPVVSDFGNGRKPVEILGFLNFTLVGTGIEGAGNNAKASVRAIFNGVSDASLGLPKHTYGIVDPDNVRAGSLEDDYLNRLKMGYSGVIQVNDRLIPEAENKPVPTEEGVEFRLEGDGTYQPNQRVIIPITRVGPEIASNSVINATATTIYDLQQLEDPNGIYKLGVAPDGFEFGSSVQVIGFAEFEIIPVASYTRLGDNYGEGDTGDLGPYQPGQVRGKFIRYIVKPDETMLN